MFIATVNSFHTEIVAGVSGDMDSSGSDQRHPLTPAQIHQLMSVIAGMETVKEAGANSSPPPTDEEIQQFLDYVGMGVVNTQRVEYEENRQNVPEPPRRNKQACQYFWRRHYLSIIQEDEEEHNDATPGSSRQASRPGSTYENQISRLSRVIGALSPVNVSDRSTTDTEAREIRGSWGSEMSLESMTSINSILSEEGSITSNGSFDSNDHRFCENNESNSSRARKAPQNLSSLLESVHPPSNTPDSMLSSCDSPNIRLSKADSENEDSGVLNVAKFKMGSKFKQSIQQIEELKRKGKREFKELSEKVFQKETYKTTNTPSNDNSIKIQSPGLKPKGPTDILPLNDPPSTKLAQSCYENINNEVKHMVLIPGAYNIILNC